MIRVRTFSGYFHEYQKSINHSEVFWNQVADNFFWRKRWTKMLKWNFEEPKIEWFIGAELNITENIFERRLLTEGDRTALIWEPNNPNEASKSFTYQELYEKVCQAANMLTDLGIQKGDRVALYMPMVPELAIATLACARVGAIHSVVFGGFSANALAERIKDAEAKLLITADGSYRGDKLVDLKKTADEALSMDCTSIEKVLVVQRAKNPVTWNVNDVWWHDEIVKHSTENKATAVESEHPLFILYTSGSTGKPKGIVHTTAGYMVFTSYTFKNVFQFNQDDIHFCTADIGWITGHSYIIYGPLLSGATSVMFEGIPTYPDAGRFWDIVDKYKVTHFYTAPTAIRSLMTYGLEPIQGKDLSSLRVLGSVGEPINVEAWTWFHTHIGKGRCPIVDTWWQTETGGILLSPLAGITPTKPAYATLPLPGIQPIIVDNEGNELEGNSVEGNLCIKYPWPGMLRTLWKDHERCQQTYFSTFKGLYFTGDGVKRDEDGYYRILGRVDDVINVSGHRLGTAEIENAINTHPRVSESAVVGFEHPIKGQGIFAYVVCMGESDFSEEGVKNSIIEGIVKQIGPIAKPDKILVVNGLPKTRSGKIMRRILRKIAHNEFDGFGDTSTLLNPEIVNQIIEKVKSV